jgi:Rad3-related DNA helicase
MSPFDLFEKSLNHCFSFKYQGNHIIEKDQFIFKFITFYTLIEKTPRKNPFKFTRISNDLDLQYKILGYLLYDLSRITPDGIIIFFTCITVLNDCVRKWKEEGIYNKIDINKKIILDNTKMKLKQFMLEDNNNFNSNKDNNYYISYNNPLVSYKNSIDEGSGGILLSIFKGKICKNINFKGKYGRMLINVGIPFINKLNEKNKFKENYLKRNGKNINLWEKCDAMLKINQSCGRIIRDKNDYGVILNVDVRNIEAKMNNYLSGWLKNSGPQCEEYKFNENEDLNIKNNKFIQEIENFYIYNKNKRNNI